MKWFEILVEWLVNLCAFSGLLGLLVSGIFFLFFHLGVRDFQDYEHKP